MLAMANELRVPSVLHDCPDLPPEFPQCLDLSGAQRIIRQLHSYFGSRRVPGVPPLTGVRSLDQLCLREEEHRARITRLANGTVFALVFLARLAELSHTAGGHWRRVIAPACLPGGVRGSPPREVRVRREREQLTAFAERGAAMVASLAVSPAATAGVGLQRSMMQRVVHAAATELAVYAGNMRALSSSRACLATGCIRAHPGG